MPSEDFDFANTVCSSLGSRAERDGTESLSGPERNVLLVWWAQGIIGNGGFEYFYEGACNMAEVAEAFQELGFSEASQACRQSLTLFPLEILGGDPERFYEWMTRFDEDYIKKFFLPLSRVIWATDDNDLLSYTVAQYVRSHLSDFSEAL
jgi:hypothetical protein